MIRQLETEFNKTGSDVIYSIFSTFNNYVYPAGSKAQEITKIMAWEEQLIAANEGEMDISLPTLIGMGTLNKLPPEYASVRDRIKDAGCFKLETIRSKLFEFESNNSFDSMNALRTTNTAPPIKHNIQYYPLRKMLGRKVLGLSSLFAPNL